MHKVFHRAAAAALSAVLCSAAGAALAADGTTGPAQGPGIGSVLQMFFGLAVVLGVFFGAVWLMKKSGAVGGSGQQVLKIVSSVAVGTRERVVLIEIGEQWIVAGVAPGSVNQLASMPRGELIAAPAMPGNAPGAAFAGFLKQVMDKRNGK
jgi:flagellar protein FliO/FliZ